MIVEENMMQQVLIGINRDDLPSHSDGQFEEWVQYCVGHRADIDSDNPLSDLDLTGVVINIGK